MISRPSLDLSFELGWMIFSWMLQESFLMVICMVIPYNQDENNDQCLLGIGSQIVMLIEKKKTEMVVESAYSEEEV